MSDDWELPASKSLEIMGTSFYSRFHASVVTFHWRREQYRHVTGTRKLQPRPMFRSTGGVGREIIDTFSALKTRRDDFWP